MSKAATLPNPTFSKEEESKNYGSMLKTSGFGLLAMFVVFIVFFAVLYAIVKPIWILQNKDGTNSSMSGWALAGLSIVSAIVLILILWVASKLFGK